MTQPSTVEEAFAELDAGHNEQAATICEQILLREPANGPALHLLGVLKRDEKRYSEAIGLLQRAMKAQPDDPGPCADMVLTYQAAGRMDMAVDFLKHTLTRRPEDLILQMSLAQLLRQQGKLPDAIREYGKALQIAPRDDQPGILDEMGVAQVLAGQLNEAVAAFAKAIDIQPAHPQAIYHLGKLFAESGQSAKALPLLKKAVTLAPGNAPAQVQLGLLYADNYLLSEALACHRKALAARPDYAEAHSGLANAALLMGDLDTSLKESRAAIDLRPEWSDVASNRLLALHYRQGNDAGAMFEEHRAWADKYGKSNVVVRHPNDPNPDRPLRIGYVSGDFCEHSVTAFFEGVLACHDKSQFHTICYAVTPKQDAVTERLRRHAGTWRAVPGISNQALAAKVWEDHVDILVDLSGHTAHNRLPAFALRPAPVQVTWLGYANTTGLAAIDYRITDALVDPPGLTDAFNAERLLCLPATAWCFHPPENPPAVAPSPAAASGLVTFGSFNNLAKISPEIIDLWCRILTAVPGSRMVIKAMSLRDKTARAWLLAAFTGQGITPARVDLQGPKPMREHLESYAQIDIALDTFPYHGTTTTFEAIYMGVPVITLAGKTHVSRVGVSILTNQGKSEWVAQTSEEYVAKAVQLASDVPALGALRKPGTGEADNLRRRLERSPLMDAPAFTRALEDAYRQIWRGWFAKRMLNPRP